MSRKSYSKESIIQILQNLAKRLGKEFLTNQDVRGEINVATVRNYFGSLKNAFEAAGIKRKSLTEHLNEIRKVLPKEELFLSMFEVERSLGHEPTGAEYTSLGKYSIQPFIKRFGKWPDVLSYYRKWKSSRGPELTDINIENKQVPNDAMNSQTIINESKKFTLAKSIGNPAQLYGEPIEFRGLRHAPINEQGVVYLFGMVSRELGFYIEAIQQGFPDCEGKYLHDSKKNLWAKARIEFEFKASNFQEHGHDPNQCDIIVCWINDWPECPITVINLRKEILKLPH